MHTETSHKHENSKDSEAEGKVYMSFWTQEGEKEQTVDKKFLSGSPETMGQRGLWQNRFLLGFSLSATLHSYVLR